MSDFMSPGRRIRHYRMLRGMTQKALGIAAGFLPENAPASAVTCKLYDVTFDAYE